VTSSEMYHHYYLSFIGEFLIHRRSYTISVKRLQSLQEMQKNQQSFLIRIVNMSYWYGLLIWVIDIGYWYGLLIWVIDMSYWYGLLIWVIYMDYWYGLLIWVIDMDYSYGSLIWVIDMNYWYGFRITINWSLAGHITILTDENTINRP